MLLLACVQARMQLLQQSREREAAQAAELAAKNKIKHGEAGYRWHASIPQVRQTALKVHACYPVPVQQISCASSTLVPRSR
jgi:hypothetical protein